MTNFQILLLCTSKEKKEAGQGQVFNPQFGKSISYLNALNFPYSFSCSLSDYKIQHILSQFFFLISFKFSATCLTIVRMFFIIFPRAFPWISHILSKFSLLSNYQSDIVCWLEWNKHYSFLILLLSPSNSEIPVRIIKNVTNDMLRTY